MRTQLRIRAPNTRAVREVKHAGSETDRLQNWARANCREWQCAADLGRSYRMLFAKAWMQSTRSTRLHQAGLAQREVEFVELLDSLFPVHEISTGYPDDEDIRVYGPPVMHMGIEMSYDYEYQASSIAANVLAYLAGCNAIEIAQYLVVSGFPYVLPIHPKSPLQARRFQRLCATHANRNNAWADLPMALCVFNKSTGSLLVDSFYEDTFAMDQWLKACGWSVKGLRRIQASWQCADVHLQAFKRADAWLTKRPQVWLQVFKVWLEAHK